jgi:phospholipid/cholesterol/gamma-HCH transport system substrate-binding protein
MEPRKGETRIAPAWWATMLVLAIVGFIVLSWALYQRAFTSFVPVTLTSERSGLMLESGGKVKMRGVEVGRVAGVNVEDGSRVNLKLEIDPDQIAHIPANVEAQITAGTAFGAKYVDLLAPENPSGKRLSAHAVLHSRNVSTEVNTVFENLVGLLDHIDPAKLNAVLTTLADGLRGKGDVIGEATTDANQVLLALNSRSETIRQDFRSFAGFSDTYSGAAQDILTTLDAVATTSTTLTNHSAQLDALLLTAIGLSRSGIDLIGPSKDNLVRAVNITEPTTNLLMKYNPEYTCLLVGAKNALDMVAPIVGGNGRTLLVDAALLLGNDPYVYPDNLPIIAAKGGPGGKPSCGSLPDATKNFPVRQLVTNTGWGTGVDIRPNWGLGHPCYANYLPVTRAVPEPPSVRCQGAPSPGLATPPPGPLPFGPPTP